MSKPQALFMTSTKLDHQINLGSRIASKANLASAIKVTFEPSMAIHWLVLSRLRRTKISTTLLPMIMMLIGKKSKEKSTFISLCLLFEEFHMRFI
ncbi:hypothetical protein MmazTMA_11650 [Methanosarcina mazei]|nr:hypothetical protein MmazTMA_11650 [Methanosarcina mazei]